MTGAGRIATASVHDGEICRRFEDVAFVLKHPGTLAHPAVLLRPIRVNRRARKAA